MTDKLEKAARAMAATDPEVGANGYDILPDTPRPNLPKDWCKAYWRSLAKAAAEELS